MSKRCDFMLDEESTKILMMIPKPFRSIYIRNAIKNYKKTNPKEYDSITSLRI